MRLSVRTPATIVDMALYGGGRSYRDWLCLKLMHERGDTFVVSVGDEVICLVTLFPHPSGLSEATFSLQASAAPHMLALCRLVRLTLSGAPYPAIMTVCRTAAGARIARACGFVRVAETELGEVWEHGKLDRRRRQQAGGAPAATDSGSPAAPPAGGDGGTAGRT